MRLVDGRGEAVVVSRRAGHELTQQTVFYKKKEADDARLEERLIFIGIATSHQKR